MFIPVNPQDLVQLGQAKSGDKIGNILAWVRLDSNNKNEYEILTDHNGNAFFFEGIDGADESFDIAERCTNIKDGWIKLTAIDMGVSV